MALHAVVVTPLSIQEINGSNLCQSAGFSDYGLSFPPGECLIIAHYVFVIFIPLSSHFIG
jgi:hypothetical protein